MSLHDQAPGLHHPRTARLHFPARTHGMRHREATRPQLFCGGQFTVKSSIVTEPKKHAEMCKLNQLHCSRTSQSKHMRSRIVHTIQHRDLVSSNASYAAHPHQDAGPTTAFFSTSAALISTSLLSSSSMLWTAATSPCSFPC